MEHSTDSWFATLDRFAHVPFVEDGRQQPPMPADRGGCLKNAGVWRRGRCVRGRRGGRPGRGRRRRR
jgi:hypothetical protein